MEKDTLSDDREDFALCLENETEQRKVSQDDLEFTLLDKQWSETDVSARKDEGRPCLTINKLKAFGKQVTNDGRLNRPSINIKPVGSGANKETADILSDLIRNIETMSQADTVYDTAFGFAVYGGFGYFRVNVDYTCEDEWDQDISLSRISNPFSVYGDYESEEATSIDWNRAYVTEKYSKKAFEKKWGKDFKASSFEAGGKDYDESWFKDDRILVAERWVRDEVPVELLKLSNGSVMMAPEYLRNKEAFDAQLVEITGTRDSRTYKVKQRIITGTDILEENDWVGKYIPIVPMYGEEINVNGKRYFRSLIHSAKDSQRLFNYQRSQSAEKLSLQTKAPWMGPVGMFSTEAAKWGTANRTNHPYLEYDVVPEAPGAIPTRIPFTGAPTGEMQEAMMASDDMKAIVGMYDASLGAKSNETSGKAIMARQREGDTSTFDFIDNRNRAVEHGGRIIADLIPKVYSTERIQRCVQEDGTTYTIPVNQPVAPRQAVEQAMGKQPEGDGDQGEVSGPPEYVPVPKDIEQQVAPEQMAQLKAVTKIFDLTVGKYDVMVTAGPGFNTRREQASQEMMEFVRIYPASAPFIGDLLAKNLDWPGSDQVAERLKAMLPPQAQGKVPPMVQQLQQMLQQQDAQAKQAVQQLSGQIQQLQKELADKQAEMALKSREVGVKEFDAQTKRAEAMKQEAGEPEQGVDPLKVEELRLKAIQLELDAREQSVSEYNAQTERLKLLAERLPPEAFQILAMKTTGEAMSTTLESATDNPMAAMEGAQAASQIVEPEVTVVVTEDAPMGGHDMPMMSEEPQGPQL